MSRKVTEEEIIALEEKIDKLRASKPAHDATGVYVMGLLELEDELQAKKKSLQQVKG